MQHKILFILFFLINSAFLAQNLKCDYCGKIIDGYYISYEGKLYHKSCFEEHIQLKCADCGKPIDGKFISINGKNYHEECYNKSIALKCDLCSGIINGTFITDYWGNNYHSFHVGKDPRCDYCGRFISPKLTKGGSKYSDGRMICHLCKKSSVNSLSKAKTIFNKVILSLEQFGINLYGINIHLKLVNKNELQSITFEHKQLSDSRGFAKYTYYKRGNEITSREFVVYILNGMPQKDFEAVAAHELMHVWQYINSPNNLELQLAEGSAEYASYLYMKKQHDEYSKYIVHEIETNLDEIYGEGFRKIKRIVDAEGLSYLLNLLRKSNKLPAGY